CCFEVDEPVYADFCHIDGVDIKDVCVENNNGKYNIDLQNTNRMILENAGVLPKNITVTDLCTKCHNDIFHSRRPDIVDLT
ncbi:MAG: laccase domain-containing protein, partial [Oscillospiraceae bacterium]